ncbi:MAG: DUF72 domain-containing protein, partial [Deltaproteobacteria bacterium]|nr:DUF72 domain-containing protein [Deltaproteobacteria bacterium]
MNGPFLGTSGYDYDAWVGSFYPESLKKKERLGYYASKFGTIEINASFYKKPTKEVVAKWAAQVPPTFKFILKGWQRVSHQKRLIDCGDFVSMFCDTARTLGAQLGAILWQLPPNFKKDAARLREFMKVLPADLRFAFEFRNESWFDEEVFTILREAKCALCIADAEDRTTPPVRTAPFGYFRLRREDYDDAALSKWAKTVREAGYSEDVFVFF